jgi:hypothetical protein
MQHARKIPQKPSKPALNRGRVQRAARRAFFSADVVSTSDVVKAAFCRKILLRPGALKPHDYRHVRRVLDRIALRVRRSSVGSGAPWLWRLKDKD